MNECVIYDFETLNQNQQNGVVVSFAIICFSEKRYTEDPYTYEELLELCHYIKFDVEDQVKNWNRKICKNTLQWWNDQGAVAKKQLKPSKDDVSIDTLYDFIQDITDHKSKNNIKKAYTRGNTFDPVFLQYLMAQMSKPDPFHWGATRDTRSMIEGMSFGMNVTNSYIPGDLVSKFVKHDPRHDIAMDVMRMQYLARAILTA